MISKVYEEIKTIIKENYKFFIILLLTFIICSIELPYYIEAPGGIINVEDRVEVENGFKSSGSLNMAYVSEYKATIPTILISKINKDWNLQKRETDNINNTTEADYFRNHLLLEEANQNAIEIAYKTAGLDYKKENTKLYITYIYENANTDLEIKDQITKINNNIVKSKEDIQKNISTTSKNEIINITVLRDNKELTRTAQLVEYNNKLILGIVITEKCDIKTTPELTFNFNESESGPSGGLMMTLAIYNALTETDITKGRKIVGTGTINNNGEVGEIDGVKYKLKAAIKEKADIFLVPKGNNSKEAQNIAKKENYKIQIVPVGTFKEALDYLKTN